MTAWTDSSRTTPANVIASQRVLTNYGTAFNEVSGIPVEQLSNHYLWTWYDMKSPGMKNRVLVHNPTGDAAYYEIIIGSNVIGSGTIPANMTVTPWYPAMMDGPVEVRARKSDIGPVSGEQRKLLASNVMCSQRVLYDGYFNEVVGEPVY